MITSASPRSQSRKGKRFTGYSVNFSGSVVGSAIQPCWGTASMGSPSCHKEN
jgi:hypothetical protein